LLELPSYPDTMCKQHGGPAARFAPPPAQSAVRDRLGRAGVDARVGPHYVRFSPSVYNDMDDIEVVLRALS